jgi:hypothetical protein
MMRSDWPFIPIQGKGKIIMRTILLSFVAALVLLCGFSSCSTSVKTDSGHGVTAGVH